jgi:hypothetical protein
MAAIKKQFNLKRFSFVDDHGDSKVAAGVTAFSVGFQLHESVVNSKKTSFKKPS